VLNFILPNDVYQTAKKHNSSGHIKKFATFEHLATMIFTVTRGFGPLRQVSSIMLASEGKINHFGLNHFPKPLPYPRPKREGAQQYLPISIISYPGVTIVFYRTAGFV
jgi:hypothetical protein